jgi:RNA polymerase sigma-70 factor (ECF subfamily)
LYELCVREQAASLYRVAYRLTGNADAANELVQETFLIAWRSLGKLNDQTKMRGWIFSILRNQQAKQVRRRHQLRVGAEPLGDPVARAESSQQRELRGAVQAALADLDRDFKLPVLLVAMEGLSVEEAAEALGIPRGTVLSRLHRGRQKLKAALERLIDRPAPNRSPERDSQAARSAGPNEGAALE